MLSDEDREALSEARRELMRSGRPRRRAGKNAHLFAYVMWGVLGTLVLVLGVMLGVTYQGESTEVGSGAPDEEIAGKADPTENPPPAKPKPVAQPDPEAERRRRGMERDQQEALRKAAAAAEREEAQRRETARLEAQRKEAQRKEAQRKEAQRKEAQRKEKERKAAEREETERKAAEHEEAERKEAERKANALSPAVQRIHDLLTQATKGREASRATKSRVGVSGALNDALQTAWRLTSGLKKADRRHQNRLRILIHNDRGACQEILAELARHRRPQEVMKIRSRTQGIAVLAYEKTLKMDGDTVCSTGSSAKAWALHRIAVLSSRISAHHAARQASYIEQGNATYPRATLISKFRIKAHEAIERLKAEHPKAKDESGRLLSSIVEE